MGMEYKRILACPNDCILYRKEFEDLKKKVQSVGYHGTRRKPTVKILVK